MAKAIVVKYQGTELITIEKSEDEEGVIFVSVGSPKFEIEEVNSEEKAYIRLRRK